MLSPGSFRIGHGFDVHAYSDDEERVLVLGGVRFTADEPALAGHSDADVVAHAITDALLGGAGLGDIGTRFPDTDPQYAGADSVELLRLAAADVRAHGWAAVNVDCTIVLDEPRIAPVREQMQRLLSDAVDAPVAVKGKRSEGVGALGRREGVACWAVALLTQATA